METPEDPWVQLKFRVRKSLHAKLEEAARKNSRSLNLEISLRLWRSFEWQDASRHPWVLASELRLMAAMASDITKTAIDLSGDLEAAGRAGGSKLIEENDK